MSGITSYLQPGRLADVLALIQVLAFDKYTDRTEDKLDAELQRKPTTGGTWLGLASEHPEFFRVGNDQAKIKGAALLARYVLDRQPLPNGNELRPPLDVSVVNKLMELAIQLHDKQSERATQWKTVVIPMGVAVISALASMYGAFVISSKPAAPAIIHLVAPPSVAPTVSPVATPTKVPAATPVVASQGAR